ncbi:ATP-binding protein [Duganella sp. HH105]|uniref:ATP-binding protein n=1 Tax=Duganella sp. HH105 TaxID=1781067 RepID=UPI0009000EF8|nr:ATP-binding protein [Duganella sp. HH105]
MNVIFLAGVHGVGKGYLGAPVAASLNIVHCTASQLIRDEKGRATWGGDKLVADVDDNQVALINAVNRQRASTRTILLDGHFVLRGMGGGLIRLAIDVFSSLRLSGVILLCDDAETIAARLASRDGVSTSSESIAELAAEEAAHARAICCALEIPLIVVDSPTEMHLMDAVMKLLAVPPERS